MLVLSSRMVPLLMAEFRQEDVEERQFSEVLAQPQCIMGVWLQGGSVAVANSG